MPPKNWRSTWKDEYYVKVYEMSRSGMGKDQIARALGMAPSSFKILMAEKPAILVAIKRGRNTGSGPGGAANKFFDFVAGNLPLKARKLYRLLTTGKKKPTPEQIDELFANHSIRLRQSVWLHVLVSTNFNTSAANRITNISYGTFENWKRDPGFGEIFAHIHTAKKDFAEACLMGLVASGDSAATIFVNRTLNRDRGYDPKITIVHEGSINHTHVSMDQIVQDLPLEARVELLKAIRKRRGELPVGEPNPLALPAKRKENA